MFRIKEALTTVSAKVSKQTVTRTSGKGNVKISSLGSYVPQSREAGKARLNKKKSLMPLTISFDDLDSIDRSPGDILQHDTRVMEYNESGSKKRDNTDELAESSEVVLFISSTRPRPSRSQSFEHDDDDENVSF